MKHILELQPLHVNVASTRIDKRRSARLYKILMTINLMPMDRHDERLDENGTGPIEYLLFKLASILLLIEDSQHVKPIIATMFRGVIKD